MTGPDLPFNKLTLVAERRWTGGGAGKLMADSGEGGTGGDSEGWNGLGSVVDWDGTGDPAHYSDRREQSPERCLSGCGSHSSSVAGTPVPGRAQISGNWLHPLLMLPNSKPPALCPQQSGSFRGREVLQTQTLSLKHLTRRGCALTSRFFPCDLWTSGHLPRL